jgi:hypothetical protein
MSFWFALLTAAVLTSVVFLVWQALRAVYALVIYLLKKQYDKRYDTTSQAKDPPVDPQVPPVA